MVYYNKPNGFMNLVSEKSVLLPSDWNIVVPLFQHNLLHFDDGIKIWAEEDIKDKVRGKNFVDIGMNYGAYTLMLHDMFEHCYGFEPNKHLYNIACGNIAMYDLSFKTTLYNYGLSDKEEVLQYVYVDEAGGGNMFIKPDSEDVSNKLYHKYDSYNVNFKHSDYFTVKKLDDFMIENIGFMKIDVEGFELNVLKGAEQTIVNSNYPMLLIESWDVSDNDTSVVKEGKKELHDTLMSYLTDHFGYTVINLFGENYLCEKQ